MHVEPKSTAQREVDVAVAMFEFSLLALAVYRNPETPTDELLAAFERSATELETELYNDPDWRPPGFPERTQ